MSTNDYFYLYIHISIKFVLILIRRISLIHRYTLTRFKNKIGKAGMSSYANLLLLHWKGKSKNAQMTSLVIFRNKRC